MLPPSEWYAQQDLSKHYMRRTDRPFEEGVSRGQLRVAYNYICEPSTIEKCYPIIIENRDRKGRKYGMAYNDLIGIRSQVHCFLIPKMAAAICVVVAPTTCYVSSWGDVSGYSPVVSLCRYIYGWCPLHGFDTLDIGIGGDEGLDNFKRRLGFRRDSV